MRLPNAAHESRPWRIREIAPDFILEDVWALPVHGGAEDFQALIEIAVSSDPADAESLPTRVLWNVRDRLGSWLHLGRISTPIDSGREGAADKLPIPGKHEASLAGRLPDDLRDTAADLHFDSLPFTPLYRTDVEFAAELSNRTVHGVMHLAWVDQGAGIYQGQMAVYVKPRGPTREGLHGAHQAVPVLDCLPSAHAPDRADLERPPAVEWLTFPPCAETSGPSTTSSHPRRRTRCAARRCSTCARSVASPSPRRRTPQAFERAVDEVAEISTRLLSELVTSAPPKDREVEAAKRRALSAQRFAA